MGEHTPLPWSAEGPDMFGDYNIVEIDQTPAIVAVVSNLREPAEVAANAAFIVRAVNSHYDLIEALEAYCKAYDEGTGTVYVNDQIRKALARTKEAEANHA